MPKEKRPSNSGGKLILTIIMREMRSVRYLARKPALGEFLGAVGDLAVLENLERIGPASGFSEKELAWFAENLPECEVVE